MSTNELPENAIPVDTAVIWVDTWRESDRVLPLNAFVIPKVDLTEVLAEGASAVRSYLAIDPNDDNEYTRFHTLIVGIDAEGNDMLNPDLGQYVYDFSHPCPPTCSSTGKLK